MLLPSASAGNVGGGPRTRTVPEQLLRREWNLSRFPSQPVPETALQFGDLVQDAAIVPSHLWLFDEAAGNYIDRVGGVVATPTGAVANQLRSRRCVGLLKGSGPTWRTGIEMLNATGHTIDLPMVAGAGGFDIADPGRASGRFALGITFRGKKCYGGPINQTLLFKYNNSRGYWLYLEDNGGSLTIRLWMSDGVTNITHTHGTISCDQAWHQLWIDLDFGAAKTVVTYLDGVASGSTALGTLTANFSPGASLQVGSFFAHPAASAQIAGLHVLHDTAALNFTATHAARLWKLDAKPDNCDTYTATGPASFVIQDDPTYGDVIATYCANRPAYRRAPNFGGVALATHAAAANLLSYSGSTSFSALCTVTNDAVDGPSGMRDATQFVATAPQAFFRYSFAVTAGVKYIAGIVLWAPEPCTLRVAHMDAGSGVTYAFVDVAVTSKPRLYKLKFTGNATTTETVTVLLDPASNAPIGRTLWTWHVMVRQHADSLGPIVLSYASPGSRGATTIGKAEAAGLIAAASLGALEVEFEVEDVSTSLSGFAAVMVGAGNANRRQLQVDSSERVNFNAYDSAAVLGTTAFTGTGAVAPTAPNRYRGQWKATGALPNEGSARTELQNLIAGTEFDGRLADFTATETITTLRIGCDESGANQIEGSVRLVRTYSAAV